ncbi:MAG: NfeD family protein [Eubacteriales bacterium]|nr:NfeD family protein [Eubacteriales bacterium]
MMEWWESLSMFGRVLACIAIPSTLLLLIQTILAMIGIGGGEDSDAGFDADADADADFGTEGADTIFGNDIPDGSDLDTIDAGLRLLSLRSIIAFSAVFSWTGLLLLRIGSPMWVTVAVSLAAGFAAMLLVAILIRQTMRLQADGTKNIRSALGRTGTVYLRVPATRGGTGKVTLLLGESYEELSAVTDEETDIPSGREVIVIGVSGSSVVVKTKE